MSPLDLSNQIPHSNTLSKELGVRRTLSSYKPWGFFSQRCSCTQRDHPLLMRTCCLEKSFSCSWCFWVYRFPKNHWTLQWRGGRLCIAKFRDLQTTSFEIPWFLGLYQFHRISPINLLNSMNFTPFSTQALLFWSSQSLWKVRNLQISQAVMIQKQSSQLSPETKCTNKTKEEERIIFLLHLQISTSTFQFGCQWKTLRDGGLTACNGIIWHPLEGPGMKHLLPHLLGNVYVSGVLRNLHTTWSTWVLRIIQHQYPLHQDPPPQKNPTANTPRWFRIPRNSNCPETSSGCFWRICWALPVAVDVPGPCNMGSKREAFPKGKSIQSPIFHVRKSEFQRGYFLRTHRLLGCEIFTWTDPSFMVPTEVFQKWSIYLLRGSLTEPRKLAIPKGKDPLPKHDFSG